MSPILFLLLIVLILVYLLHTNSKVMSKKDIVGKYSLDYPDSEILRNLA